jgi:hypothetical protein
MCRGKLGSLNEMDDYSRRQFFECTHLLSLKMAGDEFTLYDVVSKAKV